MIACFSYLTPAPSPPRLRLKPKPHAKSNHHFPQFKLRSAPWAVNTQRIGVLKESEEVETSSPNRKDDAGEVNEGEIRVNGFELERKPEEPNSFPRVSSKNKKRPEEIDEGFENRFKLRNGREVRLLSFWPSFLRVWD